MVHVGGTREVTGPIGTTTYVKLAYFGTPQFAADFLEKILTDPELQNVIDVVLVVTQPDKPVGRKQILTPSPITILADKHNIPVSKQLPEPLTTHHTLFTTCDLALVYAYGKIIPADLLQQPRFGFWNIHPSLLPKYRGASPTAYPLITGDEITGVTLMQMDEKMDHGPIIAQEKYEINQHDRRPDLERELTNRGFELFKHHVIPSPALRGINSVEESHPQDHTQATFTKLLKKDDGFIPLEEIRSAIFTDGHSVYNKFRGLFPWPGIWTIVKAQFQPSRFLRLKITDCSLHEGKLVIQKVKLEGKNETEFRLDQLI